jgi:glycosyltransferase involved in cell wall biosynthesis
MPLVSICIPTYSSRRLPYLREAVAAALAQTHRDIEVVLSDNGSDPSIRAFAAEQSSLDSRVRYRRNDPSVSLAGNFNAVLQDSRGEYVLFNGDDDRLLPTCVEKLLAAHDADTVVAFSHHYIIDDRGERNDALTRHFAAFYSRAGLPKGRLADPVLCAWRNSIPLPSSLIRAAEARRLGIRPEVQACDLDLFIRIAGAGGKFVFIPEFLAEYRVHPGSATSAGNVDASLLDMLEPIPVPPHVEPLKRRILGRALTVSVTAALRVGNVRGARAMIRHRYYPSVRERAAYVVVQRALALLPPGIARSSAALLTRARRAARSLR